MFRKYWHHRAFAKDLEKAIAEKDLDRSFKVNKINVVLDASLGIKHDFFLDLAKTFSVPESSISILVFESENNAVQDYANFFKKNDITFFGKFKNELSAFCSKKADLQINYFNKENIYLEWVACSLSKKMSVGFSKTNQAINDLILDIDPTNTELVKKEMVKYLTLLEKI